MPAPVPPEEPKSAIAALPAEPARTVDHIKAAAWLAVEPAITNREIARQLNPGTDGSGSYAVKAKELRLRVEGVVPPHTVKVSESQVTIDGGLDQGAVTGVTCVTGRLDELKTPQDMPMAAAA